jgi:hypothetical protein
MTQVKCDFDGRLPRDLRDRIGLVTRLLRWRVLWVRYDRTARGWHVTVAVAPRVSLMRVILAQALIGSDWRRELYNMRRASEWRWLPPYWRARVNVLYRSHVRGVRI